MRMINILIVSFIRAVAAVMHSRPRDIYASCLRVRVNSKFPFFFIFLSFLIITVSYPEVYQERPRSPDVETLHFKKAKLVRGP